MADHRDVSDDIVARIREVCLGLPDAYEEQAWVGTRWRVRKQTFAHVLMIDNGWPPVYARTVGSDGPVTVLTFQSAGQELDAFTNLGHPFFRPVWRPGIVGMTLDTKTDWREVAELVMESYCLLAPQKLVAMLDRADP
jgi:hypothetical protein